MFFKWPAVVCCAISRLQLNSHTKAITHSLWYCAQGPASKVGQQNSVRIDWGKRWRYYVRFVTKTGRKSVIVGALALLCTFCGTDWEEECACGSVAAIIYVLWH